MKQLVLIGTTGNNLAVVQLPTNWSIDEARQILEYALLKFDESKKDSKEFLCTEDEKALKKSYPTITSEVIEICKEILKHVGSPLDNPSGLIWQFKVQTFFTTNKELTNKAIKAFSKELTQKEKAFISDHYMDILPKIIEALKTAYSYV